MLCFLNFEFVQSMKKLLQSITFLITNALKSSIFFWCYLKFILVVGVNSKGTPGGAPDLAASVKLTTRDARRGEPKNCPNCVNRPPQHDETGSTRRRCCEPCLRGGQDSSDLSRGPEASPLVYPCAV